MDLLVITEEGVEHKVSFNIDTNVVTVKVKKRRAVSEVTFTWSNEGFFPEETETKKEKLWKE
jgi:hypothetical protein